MGTAERCHKWEQEDGKKDNVEVKGKQKNTFFFSLKKASKPKPQSKAN